MASVLTIVSTALLLVWCFWRLNLTAGRGHWWLKLSVWGIFGSAAWWLAAQLQGEPAGPAQAATLASMCCYLAWGMWRDWLNRRERGLP
jgi:hypothetical protein